MKEMTALPMNPWKERNLKQTDYPYRGSVSGSEQRQPENKDTGMTVRQK